MSLASIGLCFLSPIRSATLPSPTATMPHGLETENQLTMDESMSQRQYSLLYGTSRDLLWQDIGW